MQSQAYSVRGGDYESPKFRIDVATPATLAGVRGTFTPPAYTQVLAYTHEVSGGDLEARAGTTAEIVFLFDRPTDAVKLLVQNQAAVALERLGPTEFRGTILFAASNAYRLETQQGSRPANTSVLYSLRVLPDLPPRLELTGLAGLDEVAIEARLPVTIRASDDLGLDQVGLFTRAAGQNFPRIADEGWIAVRVWPQTARPSFARSTHWRLSRSGWWRFSRGGCLRAAGTPIPLMRAAG